MGRLGEVCFICFQQISRYMLLLDCLSNSLSKANFPSEYMAAVLSNNLNNISEITKFMDECRAMGMNVLSPDVNESFFKFSVNKEKDLRFGLAAIKGLGTGAVKSIVEEREANGPFTDIFDFVERIPLSSCNKKSIESLALAGAFDSLPGVSREQFFATNDKEEPFIDTLIRYGTKFQADQNLTMNSLFGDDFSMQISRPDIPSFQPWTDLEKLNKERELIGIYLSAHPLDDYELILKYVCNTSTADLGDLDKMNGREVTFGGMVSSSREGQTKHGSPFTIFKVEDFSGSHEMALFGDDSINFGRFTRPGLSLFIRGRVQPRRYSESQFELKISSIQLLPDVKDKLLEKLTIQIPLIELTDESVEDLTALLKNNTGNTLLYFQINGTESHLNVELLKRNSKITVTRSLIDYLKSNEAIKFKVN